MSRKAKDVLAWQVTCLPAKWDSFVVSFTIHPILAKLLENCLEKMTFFLNSVDVFLETIKLDFFLK